MLWRLLAVLQASTVTRQPLLTLSGLESTLSYRLVLRPGKVSYIKYVDFRPLESSIYFTEMSLLGPDPVCTRAR